MRLKLPGGDRFNGIGVLCPGGHELTFNITAPCGRVARSFKRDPLGLTRSPGGRHRRLMMRRLGSSIAILLLCATTAGAQDVLALRSATVIDGTSASPRERITILIRGERIVAVGPDGRVPIPPEATVLDATGRWVIPGLVEVHTHSTARPRLAQALALGVTSALVIAPSDSFLALGPWSAEPSSAAPRMFITPGGFTGGFPEPFVQGFALERPASPREARRAVDALTARGARQFKIWHDDGSLWSLTDLRLPMLTPEVLTEIV